MFLFQIKFLFFRSNHLPQLISRTLIVTLNIRRTIGIGSECLLKSLYYLSCDLGLVQPHLELLELKLMSASNAFHVIKVSLRYNTANQWGGRTDKISPVRFSVLRRACQHRPKLSSMLRHSGATRSRSFRDQPKIKKNNREQISEPLKKWWRTFALCSSLSICIRTEVI